MAGNPFVFDFKPAKYSLPGLYGSKKSKRSLGRRDREICYKNAGGHCEACGDKLEYSQMQVGHRRAFSKGGATTLANSACLCWQCNKWQGTGSLESLKKKLAGKYGKRGASITKKPRKPTRKKQSNPWGYKPVEMPKLTFK